MMTLAWWSPPSSNNRWMPQYIDLIVEERDMWIGVYRTGLEWVNVGVQQPRIKRWRWYIVIIPCIALRLTWIEERP
jgi:hypothetical protein